MKTKEVGNHPSRAHSAPFFADATKKKRKRLVVDFGCLFASSKH